MSDVRTFREHKSPWLTPPIITREDIEQQRHDRVPLSVSSEAAEREQAYLRALNAPTARNVQLPSVRQPVLPTDFADALDRFDDEIFQRGIAVSRDKLVSLGKQRFALLLAKDREARRLQRVIGPNTDLTSWFSVVQAFAQRSALSTAVPKRKTPDVFSGQGVDRASAAKIEDFSDLWKLNQDRETVRNVLRFHDAFESLVFGMSMLDRISPDDGRLRSRFFSSGRAAQRFTDWLGVLEQPHVIVTLLNPLDTLMCWLTNEKTSPPRPLEYAKELFNVRAPSAEQVNIAAALWRAFVLGFTSPWDIWNFIGRETRAQTETSALETWRNELAKRYRAITAFYDELRSCFCKPVSSEGGGYFQFDEPARRSWIDANIRRLLNRVSAVVAMAVAESGSLVTARFSDCVVAEVPNNVKKKSTTDAYVYQRLQAAFANSDFEYRIDA
jgi:hypothetical protein